MYPFGSGMPQPTPPQNNNMQSNAPFGAGWTMPTQNQIPAQNAYPPNSNQYPQYPPQQHSNYPQHMPNMAPQASEHFQQPHQPHYPYTQPQQYPASSPYPNNYPQSQQQQQTYPPSVTAHSYYPPSTPSHHHHQPSYPVHQGYPNQTAAASNMAQCFNEMKNHHHSPSAYQVVKKEGTPTVVPSPNFDPVKDAHDLRKAMKGFGTDEDTLINIICRRSNEQRQEIQRQYKTHFGKDLIEDIKSETSGNFEKLLVGLLLPIVDFYCTEIYSAMAGIGTDEDVLIEILCTLSNIEIHTIKNAYLRMYGEHLESELKSETSGNFKRLLVSLCTAARDESGYADPGQAQNDARELLKAGELRVGTDESTFNMILCQRNYQQLKLIFQEYEKMTGHSLEKAIKKEFSGDIMDGLLAIYKCVTDKTEYFATRLHKSMAGFGTNDSQLIRVIITRCEIDMQDIKSTFERLYGKSLKSWVKGDTSGHYKHALYALIGEQRSS